MGKVIFVQEGETIDYKNAGATIIAYNDVVSLGSRLGIAAEAIAIGATGSLKVCGVYEFPAINTVVFAVGDKVFWDSTAGKITNVAAGNTPAGWVTEPKAETGVLARVRLIGADVTSAFKKGDRFQVTYPQVAAADVAKTFFIAPAACKIVSALERHVTVAGQAGTLQIEKNEAGEAPGAGDVLLATAFDLTSTANTTVEKAAVVTAAATLAKGDALCLRVASGAATSYAMGTITVTMEWL